MVGFESVPFGNKLKHTQAGTVSNKAATVGGGVFVCFYQCIVTNLKLN